MKAFPWKESDTATWDNGMDLRDYFAAKAMHAIMTNDVLLMDAAEYKDCDSELHIAKYAYMHADAMMEVRNGSI